MSDRDARIKATKRRIRELAAAGLHCAAIARALDMDHRLVGYHARTAGIALFHKRRNVTRAQRERMAFLKRNGRSNSEIAADLGLHRATVKRNLRKTKPAHTRYQPYTQAVVTPAAESIAV
jgi:DNA-binding CsgD family transcriptional regulator